MWERERRWRMKGATKWCGVGGTVVGWGEVGHRVVGPGVVGPCHPDSGAPGRGRPAWRLWCPGQRGRDCHCEQCWLSKTGSDGKEK